MTTDRELLELAAKAAGIEFNARRCATGSPALYCATAGWWNPLTDDGDALRLAVKLRLTPHIDGNLTEVEWAEQDRGGFIAEPHIDDPYAATRRAIVRAAAEIGKGVT